MGASPKMWVRRGWHARLGDAGHGRDGQQGRPEAGVMGVGSHPGCGRMTKTPELELAFGAGERRARAEHPLPARSPQLGPAGPAGMRSRGRGGERRASSPAGPGGAGRRGSARLGQPSAPPRHAMERNRAGREPQPRPQPAQGKASPRGPAPAAARRPFRTAGLRRSPCCGMRPWGRREPGRGGEREPAVGVPDPAVAGTGPDRGGTGSRRGGC